jgi:hypothetical protein
MRMQKKRIRPLAIMRRLSATACIAAKADDMEIQIFSLRRDSSSPFSIRKSMQVMPATALPSRDFDQGKVAPNLLLVMECAYSICPDNNLG